MTDRTGIVDHFTPTGKVCETDSDSPHFVLTRDYEALEANYYDLILAVGCKWPNESRHDTAKRYIIERETRYEGNAAVAQQPVGKDGKA